MKRKLYTHSQQEAIQHPVELKILCEILFFPEK